MWVIGQVFINVGYVIGLLPVTGIQLPLISAGGTSTATTLFMIGLMANAARHEPAAVAALRAGSDDRMNRLLRLPLPAAYVPTGWRRCATGCGPVRRLRSPPSPPSRSSRRGRPQQAPKKPARKAPRPPRPPAGVPRCPPKPGRPRDPTGTQGIMESLPVRVAPVARSATGIMETAAHGDRRALEGQRYG